MELEIKIVIESEKKSPKDNKARLEVEYSETGWATESKITVLHETKDGTWQGYGINLDYPQLKDLQVALSKIVDKE